MINPLMGTLKHDNYHYENRRATDH